MPTAATNRTSTTPRPQPETPSVPFLARACDTPIVGLRAKAVFVAMARRQRTPEGSCFASDGTLAKLAGCDSRTVRRGRSDLDRMGRIEFIGWRYHGEHSRTKEWRVIPVETDSLSVPATSKRTDSPAGTDRLSDNVRREEKIKSKSAAARDPERLTCGECGNTWPAKFGAECFSCKKAKKADPAVTRRHREQMGPTYERLHTAGIEAAETAVWSDCGDCGSTVLADMTRCPTCGSTTINARPVVGLAREDAMQTNQKPAPAPRLPAVPAVPAAVPAPPIVDPPFDPREAFTPQPKPTPVMPPDHGAVLFFQLINARHERASTVLTSNKGFEEWGTVLGDEVMAAALIDRLLHHCHIVNIRGNSYRMREHQDWLRAATEKRREGIAR